MLATVPLLFKWSIVALMRTCTVRSVGAERLQALREAGRPWVYCGWHNNVTMAVCRLRDHRLAMMTSASRDGELITRAIEKFGNVAVRGSTSSQGSQAARGMTRVLRYGRNGALTPDGPRGPAYRCQSGAIWIAALSGCPLVPYHLEAERQWRLRSWDRHKIPKAFTTIHEHVGEPMYVSRGELDNGAGEVLAAFQARMLANTRACLRAAGHPEDDLAP